MADISKLSYGQIIEKATLLGTTADEMKDILEKVTTLFNMVGDESTWSGTAAANTKSTFDTLSAKFSNFMAAVQSESGYLRSVVANYQAVDDVVSGAQSS